MLTLVALLALGQITFEAQPLPDVRIGPVTPFTGQPTTNYLRADLDGDGALDLVLPGYVNLQEQGRFPESRRGPLPPCEENVEADLFGGKLYYRGQSTLQVHAWTDGRWTLELKQSIERAGDVISFSPVGPGGGVPVFRRFTCDLDGDQIPELVDLDTDGVHLYRRGTDRYENAGMLAVFPTTVVNRSGPQTIWPPDERQVVLPEQRMSCRLLLMDRALSVIIDLDGAEGKARFRRDDLALELDAQRQFVVSATETNTSDELPDHVRPCHLNGDTIPDYAGAHWVLSDVVPVPMPVQETWASLDGGKTFQIERATTFHNFRPYASFVDFDSDGDQDMVVESTSFFNLGLRESINQYLSSTNIPHTVRILPQTDGRFSSEALVCELSLKLDAPPVSPGPMLARYQAGELVNVTGDFNGDGFRDLACRRSATELEIRLAIGWRQFDPAPAAKITIPSQAHVAVADINGDTLSDVLVRWEEEGPEGLSPRVIAHFARKAAP